MAIQNEPTRITIPFADSGTKNVIPDTNSTPSASQAASWTDGFPAQCSLPLSAGGIPPARADFNGIFNIMSQSIRFGQEGGVWEWSALADYDTQRIVRGSDGLLYWSVQQSGPGFAAGAQDPTTDNGTYWKSPYAKTMGMGEDSDAVATTKWVRDFTTSNSFYVDVTNGDDASDGLTPATAFKTIAKALSLTYKHNGRLKIYVAAGSYTENIDIPEGGEIEIEIQGNVSTTGRIYIPSGFLQVKGSYTLTSDYIYLLSGAYAIFYCDVFATSSTQHVIDIEDSSYCDFRGTCTATQTGSFNGVNIVNTSGVIFYKAATVTGNTSSGAVGIGCSRNSAFRGLASVTINGSGFSTGMSFNICSSCYISSDLTIAQGSVLANAISIGNNSSFTLINGSTSIVHGSSGAYSPIYIYNNSSFALQRGTSLTVWHHRTSVRTLFLWNSACFTLSDATLAFKFESGKTATYIIDIVSSFFNCTGAFTLNFGTGTATSATIESTLNGMINIPSNGTVTGTITGKRYLVDYGGQFYVHGAGANRIPGTTAGEAKAASYGYYA